MYQITCESCGEIGIHASRTGAEGRAERHAEETGHQCAVETLAE